MPTRGRNPNFKLATVCSAVDKSENELAHLLGISLAALKAIDHRNPPLYLQLALTGLLMELEPNPLFKATLRDGNQMTVHGCGNGTIAGVRVAFAKCTDLG
ncbi:hypothetical protein KXR64_21050 [Brucella intermedia]|uniref:hypothetical protein n=1 Tax=Brucella TaxID=234 RepID=UPI000946701E|nr:hypothetical protein [Brucella intermedia]